MDNHGIKQLIKYIGRYCNTTITSRQYDQLREMKRMSKYNIYKVRILYRIAIDNMVFPQCPYCRGFITTQEDLTIDHIVPKSHGGTDDIENLQPMHKTCNSDKGCEMPEIKTCPEVNVKKSGRNHSGPRHKEREIIKSRTPDELYQKCKNIDRARANKSRTNANSRVK